MSTPLSTELSAFIAKYQAKTSDVTLVSIGDSVTTNYSYASDLADAAYRPPFITEANINYHLENKLRWTGQQYRRYGAKLAIGSPTNVFTDILGGGTMTEVNTDAVWGFVTTTDFYRPLTRLITGGTNAGVSFTYPAAMKRCNFIYHSDSEFAESTLVTITEGNGLVEVWNGSAWIEANGYTFSAKTSGVALAGGVYDDYYQDNAQKRVKMRSLTNLGAKTVSITNVGVGRFGFWGIEYSPSQYMFTYVCAAKGGHNIAMLKLFQGWMVDDFNPDLILWQCTIINQGCTINPPTLTPALFAEPFGDHYDYLIGLNYLVLPFVLFVGYQAGMVDEATGVWQIGNLVGYGDISIQDYIDALESEFTTRSAPFINCFNQYLAIASRKAITEGTDNIFTSAINGSEKTGNTFTREDVHMNDYGNKIAFKILEEYFRF